jgi:spermidine/putrescine transport system permease protein
MPVAELRYRPDQERKGTLLALPALLWLGTFFVMPLLLVFVLSFLYPTRGGLGGDFDRTGERPLITLDAYADVLESEFVVTDALAGYQSLVWMGLIAVPVIIVGAFLFTRDHPHAGAIRIITALIGGLLVGGAFALNVVQFVPGVYLRVVINSIWIAFMTTVVCLLLGYPLAFYIGTRKNTWVKNLTLFLVILPFWTNFLVRTYAWRVILGTEDGVINAALQSIGLISEPLQMMFTPGAVLVGLVYGFLPFMVLPIYASVERFDFRYVEASHDLGANDFWAFVRVVFPMTLPGVVAGCILVFIPAIGAFVTPELLGGTSVAMLGKTITDQFRGSGGNWPRGAAFSMVMMAVVMLSLMIYVRFGSKQD